MRASLNVIGLLEGHRRESITRISSPPPPGNHTIDDHERTYALEGAKHRKNDVIDWILLEVGTNKYNPEDRINGC